MGVRGKENLPGGNINNFIIWLKIRIFKWNFRNIAKYIIIFFLEINI